jgi:ribosome modulation factor
MTSNVNPDEIAACYAEYASLRADQARIGQRIASTLGRYEKLGVQPKGIKHAYVMASKDPAIAAAQHRMMTEYLAILDIIDVGPDGQGNFTAALGINKPTGEAATKLTQARVHMDGYNSGKAGGAKEACRWPAGTQEHVWWLEAWHDGNADRLAKNPDADKTTEASTARARREPPAGDEAGRSLLN